MIKNLLTVEVSHLLMLNPDRSLNLPGDASAWSRISLKDSSDDTVILEPSPHSSLISEENNNVKSKNNMSNIREGKSKASKYLRNTSEVESKNQSVETKKKKDKKNKRKDEKKDEKKKKKKLKVDKEGKSKASENLGYSREGKVKKKKKKPKVVRATLNAESGEVDRFLRESTLPVMTTVKIRKILQSFPSHELPEEEDPEVLVVLGSPPEVMSDSKQIKEASQESTPSKGSLEESKGILSSAPVEEASPCVSSPATEDSMKTLPDEDEDSMMTLPDEDEEDSMMFDTTDEELRLFEQVVEPELLSTVEKKKKSSSVPNVFNISIVERCKAQRRRRSVAGDDWKSNKRERSPSPEEIPPSPMPKMPKRRYRKRFLSTKINSM